MTHVSSDCRWLNYAAVTEISRSVPSMVHNYGVHFSGFARNPVQIKPALVRSSHTAAVSCTSHGHRFLFLKVGYQDFSC